MFWVPENLTRGFLTNPKKFPKPDLTQTRKKFQNPNKPDKFLVKNLVNTGYILLISCRYV